MKTKSCTHKNHKGDRELPITEFSRHPKTKDGYQSVCKVCNLALINERNRLKTLDRKEEQLKEKQENKKDKGSWLGIQQGKNREYLGFDYTENELVDNGESVLETDYVEVPIEVDYKDKEDIPDYTLIGDL